MGKGTVLLANDSRRSRARRKTDRGIFYHDVGWAWRTFKSDSGTIPAWVMLSDRIDPRQFSPRTLALAGSIGVALLAVSFLVELRIVLLRPYYGEITGLVRAAWQIAAGLATIGSFLLAIYNARRKEPSPEGPARHFEIKGENHDIDVHLHGFSSSERNNSVDRSENDEQPSGERDRVSDSVQESDATSFQEEGEEEAVDETN